MAIKKVKHKLKEINLNKIFIKITEENVNKSYQN